jgi:hypothetical protein
MSEQNGMVSDRRILTIAHPQESVAYADSYAYADADADADDHRDQEHAELDGLLSKMELPINRRQARRPQDVRWLIDNLGKRNSTRPGFNRAWQLLLTIAERESVLKASELRRLRKAA